MHAAVIAARPCIAQRRCEHIAAATAQACTQRILLNIDGKLLTGPVAADPHVKLTPDCCDPQAMHAEVAAQDEDVTRAQDKVADLHTEVRGVARHTYGYRRR